jgi:protein-S-isoprenylcysteine O-methyltransferase Ste14
MYLAFIFWLLGYAVYSEGLISLIFAVIFSINVVFWKKSEEKNLMKFYPEYEEYIKKTFF